jgi:hypothetical protein
MLPRRTILNDFSLYKRAAFYDELSKIAKELTRREKLRNLLSGGSLVAGGTLTGHLLGHGVEKLIEKKRPSAKTLKNLARFGIPASMAGLMAAKIIRDRQLEKEYAKR